MQEDLGQSLVAYSEFVPFKKDGKQTELGESLVAVSEKVFFQNASKINKQQNEKNKKEMKSIGQQSQQQSQNEFLQVGKWKKAKQSTMTKQMAAVKKQVDQIITQTKWHKKSQPEPQKEEMIADESIVPDLDDQVQKNEEIQDQTEQDQQQQEQDDDQEQQQEEQSDQDQEQSEEQQQQEQSEQQEQQEQNQDEEQQTEQQPQEIEKVEKQNTQLELSNTHKKQEFKVGSTTNKSKLNESNLSKLQSSKRTEPKRQSKTQNSQISLDDRTDAQSQMKRTEYLPAKWTKKRQSQLQNQSLVSTDPWKRKEAILKRILLLVK